MTKTNLFMWACALGVAALSSCGIEEPKMTESSSRTMNLLAEVLAPPHDVSTMPSTKVHLNVFIKL